MRLTWPGEDNGHDYSSQSPVLFTLEKHAFSGLLFKLTVSISCVLCSRRSITENVFLVPIMEEADLPGYSGLVPFGQVQVEFRVEVHPDDATALVLHRHTNTIYENIIPDEPKPPKTAQELEARQVLFCFFGTEFFATLLPFVGFEIVAISRASHSLDKVQRGQLRKSMKMRGT